MKTNMITAVVCFGTVAYHYIVHPSILDHSYMIGLIWILMGVGGYNFGIGMAKIWRELR